MEMTDNEIVRSYREARDKGKQVKILSQLNLCEIGEILDILTKNGVKPQELPRTRRGKAKTETVESPPKHRIRSRRPQTKGAESRSTETRCWSTNSSWNVKQTRPRKHTSPKSGSSTADKMKSISSSKSRREMENAV